MNYTTKRALSEAAGVLLFAAVFAGGTTYLESRTEKKSLLDAERNKIIEHRLDSLQNIDNLASRLDGYCPTCEYIGGYNFVSSLEKQYEKEAKASGITFEDYLASLYVEQQKLKILK